MKLLSKVVAIVYKIIARSVGKSPIFFLVDLSLADGISQEKYNLMVDRLGFD